jgi:hypothetical protein
MVDADSQAPTLGQDLALSSISEQDSRKRDASSISPSSVEQNAVARVTKEPQKIDEQGTLVTSQDRVVTSLTKRGPKDIAQASAPESATNKAEDSAAPAYFQQWFRKLSKVVEDPNATYESL